MKTMNELTMLRSLPLGIKVLKTKARIKEWVEFFGIENCFVSFSGGKDSTVLLDIARQVYPKIKAVFVDTGLEYPEIKNFVKLYENVEVLKPKMNFREVIIKYGYPFLSKEVSECIEQGRKALQSNKNTHRLKKLFGTEVDKAGKKSIFNVQKYKPLLYTNFILSNKCCDIMKKKPFKDLKDQKPFVGALTEESRLRELHWRKSGCNAFDSKKQVSNPISFWTEQDILKYIKINNLKIAGVYGDIVEVDSNGLSVLNGCGTQLKCTAFQRTGCVFCGYGSHLDTQKNGVCRYERLKHTHPKLFDYCMKGGEFYEDGIWRPDKNKQGLGMAYVINELNKLYNKKLKNGAVKKFIDVDVSEYIKTAVTDGRLPKDYK